MSSELAPARVLNEGHAGDRGRGRGDDLVEAPALDHQPLELLVNARAAREHVVLLVDQPGGGALGDRDERHLIRNLEQRQVALLGGVEKRLRDPLVVESRAESEPGDVGPGEQLDEAPLLRRRPELVAGGEQQLAARKPWCRVLVLGDVDPAQRPRRAALAGGELEPAIGDEAFDRQHRDT
jgi:hypothetical protein